MAIQKKTSPK